MPIEKLIRLILLCLSLSGYIWLLSSKIKTEFAIGFTFSSIGSIMLLAGIANILPLATNIIVAGGLVCLIVCIILKMPLRAIITPGSVFFLLLMCFFAYILYGSVFVEIDNFTHWAFVSKILITNDRFPIAADPNVWFKSYPLGSASFIYFFCEFCKADSEWFQMLVQAAMMSGMACSLFAFAKNTKGYILSAVSAVLLLCGNVGFNELYVDTLLALVSFGGIAFCLYYRNELSSKIWFVIPYLTMLMSIKNSGLFFAAAIIIYVFFITVKEKKGLKEYLKLSVVSISPFTLLALWRHHVKVTFPDGFLSKHSMSPENFEQVFSNKTSEDLSIMFESLKSELLSFSNPFIYVLIFILVIFAANKYLLKKRDYFFTQSAVHACLIYLFYQLGLLGMYLFTMPASEARYLDGYPRYNDTVLIVICGILCCAVISSDLISTKIPYKKTTTLFVYAATIIMLYGGVTPITSFYSKQHLDPNHNRAITASLIQEYNIPMNSGYIIIVDDSFDAGKKDAYFYMVKYIFGNNAKLRYLKDVKADESMFEKYPYVIMFHQTQPIIDYLESRYGKNLPRVIHTPTYQPVW